MSWKAFWDELSTPSPEDETSYQWAVIACGHVLIGAALQILVPIRFLVVGIYWLVKERRDLKLKGLITDGLVDLGFVWLGTLYLGPAWWPWTILGLIALGITIRGYKA